VTDEQDPSFGALLEFLKRSRGFDFSGYKRVSLARRFRRRMETIEVASFGDYVDYLEVHPDEYEQLFNTLLINVTEFFRDPPAWEHLRTAALPEILGAKRDGDPIRVWSAGCASGHEAYTVAMILAELLGEDAFRERVKIYATDIDEEALEAARHAIYTPKEIEHVPEDLRARYFERFDQRVAFRKDLRRSVIFGRNNLIADAPISRLDLLICRNTLMYLNAETQARIIRHFHFALGVPGVLMLGKSEMMISHRELFATSDLKSRIFRKLPRPSLQTRMAGLGNGEMVADLPLADDDAGMRDAALDVGSHPQVVVSRSGLLTFANLAARAMFSLGPSDLGRPFKELELARRPADLEEPVAEALRERRRVGVGEVRFTPDRGEERRLDVSVIPLMGDGNVALGAGITFEDVSRVETLRSELESTRRDLEIAYEELQSTNEELQSTNEELETMNEELQSTNEELETINDELRERTTELNQVNDFLETILTSLNIGVAVLDHQQRVRVWNNRAEDLWGTREDEAVDQHFLSLDIGLPTESLAPALRAVLAGGAEREQVQVEAVNRRGRTIAVTATMMPLPSSSGDGKVARGAIVLMEDAAHDGAAPATPSS
jgi:two-component system, chemotaxis family, CheB/CheR fusion protein